MYEAIPTFDRLPCDLYFRHQEIPPSAWEAHSHPWGQFNYVSRGTMDINVAGRSFLSPPHYAIWIPPGVEHSSFNAASLSYRSAYLSPNFSSRLPKEPCSLTIHPILRSILDEFARLNIHIPSTPQQERMAQVALDQIEAATPASAFLPQASSEALQAVLADANTDPGDKRSTNDIAHKFHMTARTLERRCRSELGMGFGEWRQRVRFLAAIEALDAGRTIQRIASDLGYSSPSSFISMFKRFSELTPEQYRRTK